MKRRNQLMIIGLLAVSSHNWRLWRRDHALLERLAAEHASVPQLSHMLNVSVLVAAWNEGLRIDAHLRSFAALAYPNIELIICAGGDDDTLERAEHYASARVLVLEQQPGEGKQAALARCLEQATGEIICLTDADCRYNDQALAQLLAPLIDGDEHVTTGDSRPLREQARKLLPMYLWASDIMSNAHRPAYCQGLLGRNAAVTRRAIDRIGGLAFVARTGTDYQLARRLIDQGFAIRHVGASVVESAYPETLRDYRRRQSRWLRNLLIHAPRYRAPADQRAAVTTVATGATMLLAPLFAPFGGGIVLRFWLALLAYALGAKLRYVLFAARLTGQPAPARLLAALLPLTLLDFAIWASPLFDLLHPARRERW